MRTILSLAPTADDGFSFGVASVPLPVATLRGLAAGGGSGGGSLAEEVAAVAVANALDLTGVMTAFNHTETGEFTRELLLYR